MIQDPSIFNFDFFISIIFCIISFFVTTALIVGREKYYKRGKIKYIISLSLYILSFILAITVTVFKIFVPSTTCGGDCSYPEDNIISFKRMDSDARFDNQKEKESIENTKG